MAKVKITEKPTAAESKDGMTLLVVQDEDVFGVEKPALRRMSQEVYEWSALPADIRLAIQTALLAIRQAQWSADSVAADLAAHRQVIIGTKTLTNTLAFPFNNSVQSVALPSAQSNSDYIVLTNVTTAAGNVGEVEVTDKLTNGFKLSFTGSASSATVRYVVIGGFTE